MKWPRSWSELWDPRSAQELNVESLAAAFNAPAVRNHWLSALVDDLRKLNLEVDKLLAQGDAYDKLIEISARRRQIVSVLEQIETSKNSVEMEVRHNQGSLLDSLAVHSAPGR